jgi:gas vesicle protein GvpL/GvpF/Lsr2 protein
MIPMATVTQKIFTCDVCGNADDVQTWAFGFDGKRYEIDLCAKDSNDLNKVVSGYASKARKATGRRGQRRNGRRPKAGRPRQQAAEPRGARAKSAGSKKEARTSRSQSQDVMAAGTTSRSEPQEVMAAPKQAAKASRLQPQSVMAAPRQAARTGRSQPQDVMAAPKHAAKASRSQLQKGKAAAKQAATASRSLPQKGKAAAKQAAKAGGMQQEKGIYVYGILPADIEVAGEMQGVGERPGPLGIVYSDGLAALISEVGLAERLGSPEDLRTYREILDSTAIEVPVVPLRFGTVFTGEGSLADELLAPRHDEFATALEQLEGRAQFLIKGRYVEGALTARREEDTRALQQAMEGISVDSVVREPTHEREAVHVAFLVDVDQEREVERVIEDLAREWEGRIDVRLLGPMAAYDFVRTDSD